jgi:hypothetical protein
MAVVVSGSNDTVLPDSSAYVDRVDDRLDGDDR